MAAKMEILVKGKWTLQAEQMSDGIVKLVVESENFLERVERMNEVLKEIAKNGGYDIKLFLAKNEETPQEVLEILADDGSFIIRLLVAENQNTDTATLSKLINDEDFGVAQRASKKLAERMK